MAKTIKVKYMWVLLLLCAVGCKKEDDMYSTGNREAVPLSEIISFISVSPVQLEADSATACTINVQIHPETASGNRNVKFITDNGVFANGDTMQIVTANSEGKASARLVSNIPKKTIVRVKVLDAFVIDTAITFTPALPDDMLLSADTYQGDTSTQFRITSELFRNPQRGKVSDPVKVLFSVVALDTTINLVYPIFAFSADQAATITLLNPFHAGGRFNVTAKTPTAAGDSLTRTILVIVN
jgi:hypothetical protein